MANHGKSSAASQGLNSQSQSGFGPLASPLAPLPCRRPQCGNWPQSKTFLVQSLWPNFHWILGPVSHWLTLVLAFCWHSQTARKLLHCLHSTGQVEFQSLTFSGLSATHPSCLPLIHFGSVDESGFGLDATPVCRPMHWPSRWRRLY